MGVSWNVPKLPQGPSLIQPLTLSTRLPSFVPSTLNLHNILAHQSRMEGKFIG